MPSALYRMAISTALVLVSACVPQQLVLGRPWQRVESRHFALYTDLSPAAAKLQACALEGLLAALHDAGWESTGELPVRVNVVMLKRATTFRLLGGGKVAGYMLPEALFEPWIVMPSQRNDDTGETLAHELTHFIAFQAMQNQPRWFAEGLAGYFQTGYFSGPGRFELGRAPRGLYPWVYARRTLPPSSLIRGGVPTHDMVFYASAWLLVHYLMNERAEQFATYQARLAQGHDLERAFWETFPEGPEVLDLTVAEYASRGAFDVFEFRVEAPVCSAQARPLGLADMHALSALLWLTCPTCGQEADRRVREDVMQALALEPDHVDAAILQMLENRASAERRLARAAELVRSHPASWRAWLVLGTSAQELGQYAELARDPARDPGAHALQRAPQQPLAVMLAAHSALARGDHTGALRLADHGARMQPTNIGVLQQQAMILTALGQCDELGALAKRMADIGEHALDGKVRLALDDLRTRCRSPEDPRDTSRSWTHLP